MDKLCVLFLCSLAIFFTNGQKECPPERLNLERSWEAKLEKDLDYNKNKHDKFNRTSEIDLNFIVTYFKLSESLQIFTIYSLIIFEWTDECLKWDPTKYGNTTKISIRALKIWLPTLEILSSPNQEDFNTEYYLTTCLVTYDGKVRCAPRIRHDFFCETQVKYWPFDMQDCILKFSSDIKDSKKRGNVKYKFSDREEFDTEEGERMGWSIVDYKSGQELISVTSTTTGLTTSKQKALYVTITIERVGKGLQAIIIYPLLISVALTLVSLMPIIENCHRFPIICFSILCHFVVLNNTSYHIPQASTDTPLVMIFIRGSFVMSLITLLVIYVLGSVREKTHAPPRWISFINAKVLNTPLSYVLQLSSSHSICPVESTENEEEHKSICNIWREWQSISIIGVIFFFTIFSIVYMILVSVCIPVEPYYF